MELKEIKEKARKGEIEQAINDLSQYLVTHINDDEAYYIQGRLYWKNGQHANAVACYRKAIALNPDSPAHHALEIAESVFNFYNPDLLNP
ncbi:MAG: tetratricopeptide repeat protein [Clostridiales bacterium]|nr:tetratricopeptide repeat protein [Clostridiales bacterium]